MESLGVFVMLSDMEKGDWFSVNYGSIQSIEPMRWPERDDGIMPFGASKDEMIQVSQDENLVYYLEKIIDTK